MILQIDSTNRQEITLGLIGVTASSETIKTEKQSENLLPALNKFLSKNNIQLADLKAVLVNIGSGSYTGVRIGVTVANTLGWSLDLPVFGYNLTNLNENIALANKAPQKFNQPVLPTYLDKK
ncbi:TPA: tRNA (adenosine(37)-N6)-threonylcarbamoyltransferase complex dimerization subunit type 1 TsaB [Candidatus Berkelbacteria bacterium]|uniref:Peptidase M22 glycoprotease n=1 Tax=Berkelbacteria bacterium GW2011_GWE1_39_12 TaxID=1618337 RepID=A0A0G4B3S3_9BACT|nr:MAG: peptidase M22 glycoprotease [Berkelbacteria bacterium GW2011_GWE1_39_12]HBO60405.1 tRNA (adenosine(37)-N6)-threonylcarbamoyltransferase complex dimerization subunit type 1 TsaB [Candidatus Berkelbacteria bacterium]